MVYLHGQTLLTQAISRKTEIALALIEAGADVNKRSVYGSLPLILAVFERKETIVSALIHAGADANIPLYSSNTILMHAAAYGCHTMISALINEGKADITPKNEDGQTALDFAIRNGKKDAAFILLDAMTIEGIFDLKSRSQRNQKAIDMIALYEAEIESICAAYATLLEQAKFPNELCGVVRSYLSSKSEKDICGMTKRFLPSLKNNNTATEPSMTKAITEKQPREADNEASDDDENLRKKSVAFSLFGEQ